MARGRRRLLAASPFCTRAWALRKGEKEEKKDKDKEKEEKTVPLGITSTAALSASPPTSGRPLPPRSFADFLRVFLKIVFFRFAQVG